MSPHISILLPFFNAERHLAGAVDSILANTFSDWQLLLINNGSTDESPHIAGLYARQDSRIQVLQEPCTGIVPALNRGLEYASAPFVARMDADDISLPQRLELQYRELSQKPGISMTSCQVEPLLEIPKTEGICRYLDWVNGIHSHEDLARALTIESPFPHPSEPP